MHSNKPQPLSRSEMMSRIRGKDTKPEIVVRSGLHAKGYRFRLHQRDLPGSPDLVLRRFHAVIFVHGCFWHAHINCKNFKIPRSRAVFWQEKLMGNKERDLRNINALLEMGWRVLVVWECATRQKNTAKLIDDITLWLQSAEKFGELARIPQETDVRSHVIREPKDIE